MVGTQIALLRGINVGKAKRIAMADLRQLFEQHGATDVRTLLNSGNVVFDPPRARPLDAERISRAVATGLGVAARVVVLSAAELTAILAENPLDPAKFGPSRLLVAFPAERSRLALLQPLHKAHWGGEKLEIGRRAAYLGLPEGLIESRLVPAVEKLLAGAVTMRNWATATKLAALASPVPLAPAPAPAGRRPASGVGSEKKKQGS